MFEVAGQVPQAVLGEPPDSDFQVGSGAGRSLSKVVLILEAEVCLIYKYPQVYLEVFTDMLG